MQKNLCYPSIYEMKGSLLNSDIKLGQIKLDVTFKILSPDRGYVKF